MPPKQHLMAEHHKFAKRQARKRDRERVQRGLIPSSALKNAWLEFCIETRRSKVEGLRIYHCVDLRWKPRNRRSRGHRIRPRDLRDPETFAAIERLLRNADKWDLEIARAFFQRLQARERWQGGGERAVPPIPPAVVPTKDWAQ